MINYEWIKEGLVAVFLDHKIVGKINKCIDKKWRYYPKGQSDAGEPFETLADCKKSIE